MKIPKMAMDKCPPLGTYPNKSGANPRIAAWQNNVLILTTNMGRKRRNIMQVTLEEKKRKKKEEN